MNVSVCMPYWKRQAELDRSLAAYARLYDGLEISICDDGNAVPVVAPGCIVTTLPRKDIGLNPCVSMNAAVRASTRDIVVITNPEIEHRSDVLGPMLALLQDPLDYVVARCEEDEGRILAGTEVDYSKAGRYPVPDGAHFHFCAMMHRSLFELVGGFSEEYRYGRACEDNDFLWKLADVGARFKLCDATVCHYRTPHKYQGGLDMNAARLQRRWGHKWVKAVAC